VNALCELGGLDIHFVVLHEGVDTSTPNGRLVLRNENASLQKIALRRETPQPSRRMRKAGAPEDEEFRLKGRAICRRACGQDACLLRELPQRPVKELATIESCTVQVPVRVAHHTSNWERAI
jgi:hypothetical protein